MVVVGLRTNDDDDDDDNDNDNDDEAELAARQSVTQSVTLSAVLERTQPFFSARVQNAIFSFLRSLCLFFSERFQFANTNLPESTI